VRQYPSIPGPSGAPHQHCRAQLKLDGSNIRILFDRKRGFCMFGTRKNLFDSSSKHFGSVIPLFHELLADGLEQVIRKDKYLRCMKQIVFFGEWYGQKSFSGHHYPDSEDPKNLVIFDCVPYKQGLMPPKQFMDTFGHLYHTAQEVYVGIFNEPFIQSVIDNTINLQSKFAIKQPIPEGIVAKFDGGKHKLFMAKVKTAAWKTEAKKHLNEKDWEELEELM